MVNKRLKIKLANELSTLKVSFALIKETDIHISDLSLLIKDLNYIISKLEVFIETNIKDSKEFAKFVLPFISRLETVNVSLSNIMKFLITNKVKQDIKFNYTLLDIKDSINTLEHIAFELANKVFENNR